MTFANWTFANGESHVDIRQYTPRTFANWRKSGGYSPVYLLDIRQYWRNSTTFSIIKTEDIDI
jgi:hypothetical protein